MQQDKRLIYCDLGVRPYQEALEIQYALHAEVKEKKLAGVVLAVEHPAVITLGYNASSSHLIASEADLKERNIELFRVERGGQVTAHTLGQQVFYPILPLRDIKLTPHGYVTLLENVVIATLQSYGIASRVDPAYPGVWMENDKICAIGIRFKERVTLHGIALNVTNELDIFDLIVPCGIKQRGVTSLQKALSSARRIDGEEVKERLLEQLSVALKLPIDKMTYQQLLENCRLSSYDHPIVHA
jgi:lipoate-protein ligase B